MYTVMSAFSKGSGGPQPYQASLRVLEVQTLVFTLHSRSFAEQAVTLTLSPILVDRIGTIVQPHDFARNLNGCQLYIQQSSECKGGVCSVCCLPIGTHRKISVDQINALPGVSKT